MFFLFVIIACLLILFLTIHTSRIGIEIQNLEIDTEKPKGEKINEESKIYVYLLIFRKIKLFKKDVKNMKMPKMKVQNKDIDIKILKNKYLKINYIELLQNIDVDIEKIDLYSQIGTQDAALTAILVGTISSILGVILRKPKYQIVPIYSNKNLLKIKLNCIISVYLMQYIYKLIFARAREKKRNIWGQVQNVPN